MVYKIISTSVKEALKGKIWRFFVGSFPAIGYLLTFGVEHLDTTYRYSFLIAGVFVASLVVIRVLFFIIRNTFKVLNYIRREVVYGEAIVLLKNSFSLTHNYRKIPGHNDKEFMKTMMSFCNNLKKIFDKKTKGECSVSIKVPLRSEKVSENTSMFNLCRDFKHYQIRNTEHYRKTNHSIIGNTAFQKTLNNVLKHNKIKHYLNNSISKTKDYENTSRDCLPDGKLCYESELVYPIIPIINTDPKNIECRGFICVDCTLPNVFNEDYDVAILEGVADGIYDLITERNKNKLETDPENGK